MAGLAAKVAGSSSDFALARYNADGSLDTSFGIGGIVTTDFGGADAAVALAVQADRKLVAAGTASDHIALARYMPDGTLDPTFGSGGTTVNPTLTRRFGRPSRVLPRNARSKSAWRMSSQCAISPIVRSGSRASASSTADRVSATGIESHRRFLSSRRWLPPPEAPANRTEREPHEPSLPSRPFPPPR